MTPRSTVKRVRHLASGLFRFFAALLAVLAVVMLGFVVVGIITGHTAGDTTGSGLASALTGALLALGSWWIAARLAPTPDGLRRAPSMAEEVRAARLHGVPTLAAPIAALRTHRLRRAAIARWDAPTVIQNGQVVSDDDVREVRAALRDPDLTDVQSVLDHATARYGAGGR